MSRRQRRQHHAKQQRREDQRAADMLEAAAAARRTQPTTGEGGLPQNPIATLDSSKVGDVKLIARAVARWPIREAVRPAVANEMSRLALDRDIDPSVKIKAAQTLGMMDRLNLEQEKLDRPAEQPQTNVNVNVGVAVTIPAVQQASDDDLERFVHATAGVGGTGETPANGDPVPGGVVPAPTAPKTNGVSGNGKH